MFDDRAQQHQQFLFRRRLRILGALAAILLALIVMRFYHLQIVRGSYYREMSESNRLAFVRSAAPRGIIYDRSMRAMVANRPSFSVSLVLEDVRDLGRTVDMLVKTLEVEPGALKEAIRKVARYRKFEPIRIKDDVPRDKLACLEAVRFQYPGVNVDVVPRRFYPEGALAAHLYGYVGEVSPSELEKSVAGYQVGDYVGKMGLEKEFNDFLKGIDGGLQVEVDSLGRRGQVLNSQAPLPGYNMVLTLDLELQRVAEEALGDVRGAIVVMDPRSGELLALVSHPGFDPNLFSVGISAADWKNISGDERHPMQNRAIQAQYPPGSVFKLVTSIAALQEGVITENTAFYCGGGLQFGNRYYRCWKKEGHGLIRLHQALVESCDTYFYTLGEKLGIDTIAKYARELGLGQPTGISLPGESSGLVPTTAWKRNARGEVWFPGETLNSAIGQGYNLLTPVQMAVMLSTIASGGSVWRPMLVRSILAPDGKVMKEFNRRLARRAEVGSSALDVVRRGMLGVVNEPRGTGYLAKMAEVQVAGKTGTAQVVKLRQEGEDRSQEHLPENLRDHAWFACFAPFGEPEVALVIMLEHGGHGGAVCAPVARKILKTYFDRAAKKGTAKPEGEGAV